MRTGDGISARRRLPAARCSVPELHFSLRSVLELVVLCQLSTTRTCSSSLTPPSHLGQPRPAQQQQHRHRTLPSVSRDNCPRQERPCVRCRDAVLSFGNVATFPSRSHPSTAYGPCHALPLARVHPFLHPASCHRHDSAASCALRTSTTHQPPPGLPLRTRPFDRRLAAEQPGQPVPVALCSSGTAGTSRDSGRGIDTSDLYVPHFYGGGGTARGGAYIAAVLCLVVAFIDESSQNTQACCAPPIVGRHCSTEDSAAAYVDQRTCAEVPIPSPTAIMPPAGSGSSRKISFNVSEQYDIQDVVGEGAYGVVWYVHKAKSALAGGS